jgi:hypothetical protein
MNRHKLMVLGGVAVVALAAALWSTNTRKPVQEGAPSEAVVPGLEAKLNDLTTVRVRGPGDQVLATLVRGEAGWSVQERAGYPADVAKLRAYLLKLAQARRVEEKTANPELYFKLGVEPMSTAEAAGAQLELEGIEPPVRLIVGHNVPRGSGTYVRFADQPQSWEANADLAVERNPVNWLQRDLVDVQAGHVTKIDVQPVEGPAVHVVRAEGSAGGEFKLAEIPKGREPASEFVADGIAGLLSGLRFDDVLPGADTEPPAKVQTTVFTLDDGQALTIASWEHDGKTYARLSVAKPDDVLSKRFEGHTFVLPPYKADTLNKPLEGYLKPKA